LQVAFLPNASRAVPATAKGLPIVTDQTSRNSSQNQSVTQPKEITTPRETAVSGQEWRNTLMVFTVRSVVFASPFAFFLSSRRGVGCDG
jgi:hypothetical protein